MNEKNDIYGREKRLETLLEEIKQNKNCKENTDALLKYERDMFLGSIGVERREKVTRTLFLISKWQSLSN